MEASKHTLEEWLQKIGDAKTGKGKLKIYLGMSAGVGKTYRMLQEAHQLLQDKIDVRIGYIETHNRKETTALIEGVPLIPRRELFYEGKSWMNWMYKPSYWSIRK